MPQLQYGSSTIAWVFQVDAKLKRHYVTVERGRPVLLRGPSVDGPEQEELIRRRARWIREKQRLVNLHQDSEPIVTGSRLRYCGRTYFTEVRHVSDVTEPRLRFTASRFVIENPDGRSITQETVGPLLLEFYRERAQERLLSRVRHWERLSGLLTQGTRIRVFQSRWGNCTAQDTLEFHPKVMELPASVQDYVVLHELCHVAEKNHTKTFWALVNKHMPNWRLQHETLERAAFGASI